MKIDIINHALPPILDGIGDYTSKLAEELAHQHEITVITDSQFEPTPIPNVQIAGIFDRNKPRSCRRIIEYVEESRPDWVLLQYCCFGYGKWGMNLVLPEVLHEIKRKCKTTQIAVMVHESFVQIENVKLAVMTTWQRWQLWRIGQAADIMLYSTVAFRSDLINWFPKQRNRVLPVGSNIPFVTISRDEARSQLNIAKSTIVLGLFGNARQPEVVELMVRSAETVAKSGTDTLLLYIGKDAASVKSHIGDLKLLDLGPLGAEAVSRALTAVDIYLCAYNDGVSTRRGSFMAGLQHGCAIVGNLGRHTDDNLKEADGRAFLLAEVGDPSQYIDHVVQLARNTEARHLLSSNARTMYESNYTWAMIADRLIAELTEPK
jgi:glycosyltransferase involved in cell wall biosynthesis